MSKAARLRQQRRTAAVPPPVGKQRPRNEQMRKIWLATGGLAAIVVIVVVVLLVTRTSPPLDTSAPASIADRSASPALIAAAQAVGFHPTYETGVGIIENEPASDAVPPANPDLLPVGSTAPNFTLKTPEGQSYSLSEYRGKAVLVEFFATWCPHCNAEAPHLRKIYASLSKATYAFLSVNADGETAPSIYAFHDYYGLQYPALVDPSSQPGSFSSQGAAGKVSTEYKVDSYPTLYIINPKGVITWRSDGEQPDALLVEELHKAATVA